MLSVVHNYYYLLAFLIIHSLKTSICVWKDLYMLSATFHYWGGIANDPDLYVALTRSMATFRCPEILYIIRRNCYTSQGDHDSSFPLWLCNISVELYHLCNCRYCQKLSTIITALSGDIAAPSADDTTSGADVATSNTNVTTSSTDIISLNGKCFMFHNVLWEFHDVLQEVHDVLRMFHNIPQCFTSVPWCSTMFKMFYDV